MVFPINISKKLKKFKHFRDKNYVEILNNLQENVTSDILKSAMLTDLKRKRSANDKKYFKKMLKKFDKMKKMSYNGSTPKIWIARKGRNFILKKTKQERICIVMLALLLAAMSAVNIYADTLGVVTAGTLNVRKGADINQEIIGSLNKGEQVTILGVVGDWYKIAYGVGSAYVNVPYVLDDWDEALEATIKAADRYNQIVEYAKEFLGVPYVYGGSTPRGFDCSGFVQYVYAHFDIFLPRVSYSQMNVGTAVSVNELEPGDLLFFRGGGHVGIYVGDDMYIHSPRTGRSISIDPLDRSVYAARRVLY